MSTNVVVGVIVIGAAAGYAAYKYWESKTGDNADVFQQASHAHTAFIELGGSLAPPVERFLSKIVRGLEGPSAAGGDVLANDEPPSTSGPLEVAPGAAEILELSAASESSATKERTNGPATAKSSSSPFMRNEEPSANEPATKLSDIFAPEYGVSHPNEGVVTAMNPAVTVNADMVSQTANPDIDATARPPNWNTFTIGPPTSVEMESNMNAANDGLKTMTGPRGGQPEAEAGSPVKTMRGPRGGVAKPRTANPELPVDVNENVAQPSPPRAAYASAPPPEPDHPPTEEGVVPDPATAVALEGRKTSGKSKSTSKRWKFSRKDKTSKKSKKQKSKKSGK